MDSCKLCGNKLDEVEAGGHPDLIYRARCPRCGVYIITFDALDTEPDDFVKGQLHLVSAVARWEAERGRRFRVEEKLLRDRSEFEAKILSVCPRNVQDKLDRILAYIAQKASYPRDQIVIDEDSISSLFYCRNVEEVKSYLKHLKDSNLADFSGPRVEKNGLSCYRLELTVRGWQKVEELAKPNIESTQAFVAMWFDD